MFANHLEIASQGQTLNYWETFPRDYDLLHVIPEYDLFGMSRPEVKGAENTWGLPPTVKFYNVDPTPFYINSEPSPAYQLLLGLFQEYCAPGLDPEAQMLKYLKNGVCYTDHRDPTAWNPIVTAGNVLYPTGNKMFLAGELWWEVRQLKYGSLVSMQSQIAIYSLLIAFATNSTRENDGQHVEPFHHTGGRDVPAPLFCRQATNWIRASRVRLLSRDEPIPSLYHV